jgi:proteasome lid subunit RPN8/RPN11
MIQIPTQIREKLSLHANDNLPNECCGIVVGKMSSAIEPIARVVEVWPMNNVADQDQKRFFNINALDIHQVIKACRVKFLDVIGFYHSHPFGIALPSHQDIEMATAWSGYYHLIIAPKTNNNHDIRAFITASPMWKNTIII